jgi:hypothetical protein
MEGLAGLLSQSPCLSYEECMELIASKRFVHSNAFSLGMQKLGHQAKEILYDLEPLQARWAVEHGIGLDSQDWQEQVLLEQIRTIQPDVLYLQDIYCMPFEVRRSLKGRFPFLKLVVLYKGFPGAFKELEGIDLILAGYPLLARQFSETGHPHVELVYHSFDGTIPIPEPNPARPSPGFSFVGSTGCGLVGNQHKKRYHTLLALMARTPLEVWGNEARLGSSVSLEKRPTRRIASHPFKRCLGWIPSAQLERMLKWSWFPKAFSEKVNEALLEQMASVLFPKLGERGLEILVANNTLPGYFRHLAEIYLSEWRAFPIFGLQEPAEGDPSVVRTDPSQPWIPLSLVYPNRCHPAVFGEEMLGLLHCSRVSLNMHTDAVQGEAANMRLFEVTGIGGCLLTDGGSNLKDLFEPDVEVAVYANLDECREKSTYLMENRQARDALAEAGRKRTLRSHTTALRCQGIDTHIQAMLN